MISKYNIKSLILKEAEGNLLLVEVSIKEKKCFQDISIVRFFSLIHLTFMERSNIKHDFKITILRYSKEINALLRKL